MQEKIYSRIAQEMELKAEQVSAAVNLLDQGNTVPFIARYRKEKTGELTDEQLRELSDRLFLYRNLESTRSNVLNLLDKQGVLTPQLEETVLAAATVTELDDIYRPYRPKKRTRGMMAKKKGLEPLAELIKEGKGNPEEAARELADSHTEINSPEEALSGARDIIAEEISEDPILRKKLRKSMWETAFISSRSNGPESGTYRMYSDYKEPVRKIPPHRVLAVNRGEREGELKVSLEVSAGEIMKIMEEQSCPDHLNPAGRIHIQKSIKDCWSRLLFPSLERELRKELTQRAEEQAIIVFKKNLKGVLFTSPVKGKRVLGLDPGLRTGCKLACVDETGKLLETGVIYPLPPQKEKSKSKTVLRKLIEKHHLNLIAIGNGTGGRESEEFVAEMIRESGLEERVQYSVVSEAGASVYSASPAGKAEFPHLDVAERSAVSIARRVIDPLAELVKIAPSSIGVGQYQHDVNRARLEEALDSVVEDCVNRVGVNLNTASAALLEKVAGINRSIAGHIVKHREEKGEFTSREELKSVPRLGPAAFKQCAGFLRIPGASNYLDRTAVHPESYRLAERLLNYLELSAECLGEAALIPEVNRAAAAEALGAGEYTLRDILEEFKKPGRDPREDLPGPVFKKGVLNLEDLDKGMELQGVVRNVVDFGAFVDIGVHVDGLLHISRLANRYVRHPLEVVGVGEIVTVKVEEIDLERKRISLVLQEAGTKPEVRKAAKQE